MSRDSYRGIEIVTDKAAGLVGKDPATVDCCGCPVLTHVIHKTDTAARVVSMSCIRCVARAEAEMGPGAVLTLIVHHHIHTFESLAGDRFRDASDPCQVGDCQGCNPNFQVAGGSCLHACHDEAMGKALNLTVAQLDLIRDRQCPTCAQPGAPLVYHDRERRWVCYRCDRVWLEGLRPLHLDKRAINVTAALAPVLAILERSTVGLDSRRVWKADELSRLLLRYRHDIDSKILKGGTIYSADIHIGRAGGADAVMLAGSPGAQHGDRDAYITERIPLIWAGLVKPDNPAAHRFGLLAIMAGRLMGQARGGEDRSWFEMPSIYPGAPVEVEDWRSRCTCPAESHYPATCGAMSDAWKAKIAGGMTHKQIRIQEEREHRTIRFDLLGDPSDTKRATSLDLEFEKIDPALVARGQADALKVEVGDDRSTETVDLVGEDAEGRPMSETVEMPIREVVAEVKVGEVRNVVTLPRELTAADIDQMRNDPAAFARLATKLTPAQIDAFNAGIERAKEGEIVSSEGGPTKPRALTADETERMRKDPFKFLAGLVETVKQGTVKGSVVLPQALISSRDGALAGAFDPALELMNEHNRRTSMVVESPKLPLLIGNAQHEEDDIAELEALYCASCGEDTAALITQDHDCGHRQCLACCAEVQKGDRLSHALMCPDGDTAPVFRSFLLELHGDRLRSALRAMLRQRRLNVQSTDGMDTLEMIRRSQIHPDLVAAAEGAHLLERLTRKEATEIIQIFAGEPGVVGRFLVRRGLCGRAVPDWQGVKGTPPKMWQIAIVPGKEQKEAAEAWQGEVAIWEHGQALEAVRRRPLPLCPLGGEVRARVMQDVRQSSDDHVRDVAYICRRCSGLVNATAQAENLADRPKVGVRKRRIRRCL